MTALLQLIQFLLVDIWQITAVVVLGCASVYALLPRPQGPRFWIGLGLGLCALVSAGLFLMKPGEMPSSAIPEVVLFYLLAFVAVVSGALLVTQRNPARAALSFALVVLSSCGLFLLLGAPFLSAATIIVYAGAIVVTFLFVLMLSQQEGVSDADFRSREPFLAAVAGFLLLGALLYVLRTGYGTGELDDMVGRARELQARFEQLEEQAAEPDAVATALKAAHRLVQTAQPGDATSEDGDVELLRDRLQEWGSVSLRGSDASEPLSRALRTLDTAILPVAALSFKSKMGAVNPADAQKALGGLAEALGGVADAGVRIRNDLGMLQPSGDLPLSSFSGPPSNTPLAELRRDELGRPQLPAENVAYLGRSLFSDYLLAVELGGTLLLIATIGAIAVAHARQRPIAENRS